MTNYSVHIQACRYGLDQSLRPVKTITPNRNVSSILRGGEFFEMKIEDATADRLSMLLLSCAPGQTQARNVRVCVVFSGRGDLLNPLRSKYSCERIIWRYVHVPRAFRVPLAKIYSIKAVPLQM